MNTSTIARPATDKAVAYLRSLWAERNVHPTLSAQDSLDLFDKIYSEFGLTSERCSKAIDEAKAAPRRAVLAASEVTQAEPGYYVEVATGDFIVVVQNKEKTRTYAKRLVITEHDEKKTASWEYAPGVVRTLVDITPMTIAEAASWGHLHGICAICCKTLTDPKSVERGIGPVCAKKVGVSTKAPAKVGAPAPVEAKHFCEDFDGECCTPGGVVFEASK